MADIRDIRKAYQNEVRQRLFELPAEIEEAENKVIMATNALEDYIEIQRGEYRMRYYHPDKEFPWRRYIR